MGKLLKISERSKEKILYRNSEGCCQSLYLLFELKEMYNERKNNQEDKKIFNKYRERRLFLVKAQLTLKFSEFVPKNTL